MGKIGKMSVKQTEVVGWPAKMDLRNAAGAAEFPQGPADEEYEGRHGQGFSQPRHERQVFSAVDPGDAPSQKQGGQGPSQDLQSGQGQGTEGEPERGGAVLEYPLTDVDLLAAHTPSAAPEAQGDQGRDQIDQGRIAQILEDPCACFGPASDEPQRLAQSKLARAFLRRPLC